MSFTKYSRKIEDIYREQTLVGNEDNIFYTDQLNLRRYTNMLTDKGQQNLYVSDFQRVFELWRVNTYKVNHHRQKNLGE